MNEQSTGTGKPPDDAPGVAGAGADARAPAQAPSGPLLARAIGAELAGPLDRLARLAQALRERHALPEADQAGLDQALAEARRIAIQSQQVGRLAHLPLRQSHEKLALHQVLHDVMLERLAALRAAGVEVHQALRPVEVVVDASLLVSLLDAAVEWGARQGTRLSVRLGMMNWPEHGLLVVRASGGAERQDPDCLAWFLVQQIAAVMDVRLERTLDAGAAQLALEFTRTVRRLSGLTTLDAERGAEAPDTWRTASSIGHQFAGSRVLLVTDDPALQRDVSHVCQRMNLRLDTVPTTQRAARACTLSLPHVIVIDENLHDADFDHLHADLVQRHARFPVIEVAPDDGGFAVSSWDERSTSRVGRDAVRQRLPDAIALELGKGT